MSTWPRPENNRESVQPRVPASNRRPKETTSQGEVDLNNEGMQELGNAGKTGMRLKLKKQSCCVKHAEPALA